MSNPMFSPQVISDYKGKGKEADFEAAFAQAAASFTSTSKIEEVNDDVVDSLQETLEQAQLDDGPIDFKTFFSST